MTEEFAQFVESLRALFTPIIDSALGEWLSERLVEGADAGFTALVTFSAVALWSYSKNRYKLLRIRQVPWVKIADFPERELARVQGRAICEQALEAPISGRSCVYFRLSRIPDNGNPNGRVENSQIFEVVDSSGVAEVRSITADFVLHGPTSWQTTSDDLLARHPDGARLVNALRPEGGSGKFKILEQIIEVGEEVTVSGVGRWRNELDSEPKLVLEFESSKKPLQVSNDPSLLADSLPYRFASQLAR